jgi:hypothetical protein
MPSSRVIPESTLSVISTGVTNRVTCRLDQVSRVGSGARAPNTGSGARSSAVQKSLWAATSGEPARCHISSDQRRYEVNSGSIFGTSPACIDRAASVTSPSKICQDTESTVR